MESELLDYLQHIRLRVASTTYTRKLWQIQSFTRWLENERKHYAEVSRSDVERFLLSIDAGQQFRQAVCGVVREFYDFLRVRHPLACPHENPAAKIAFKPDKSQCLPKVPSQAAVGEIFDRLSDNGSDLRIRDRLMAELAYGSGLRRTELARLDIEDIDLESNTAYVTGKGDKPRVVPITSRTADMVRDYLRRRHATRGPLLVSFFGRRMRPGSVYYALRYRVGMRPHLLRHACATHLLQSGCGVRVIQELLGHNRLSTTYLYTAIDKNMLRQVVNRSHPRGGGTGKKGFDSFARARTIL
jgi:integrase/recombinase XerC